jgi:hypothetical protein
MAGSFVGTPEYASPEQAQGGPVDSRADIYALGVILFELLTGSVPFTGSTPFAVMASHLHDPIPAIRAQRSELSPALEFVVRKALAKDPRDRYQQANELAADLQAAVKPALEQPLGMRLGGDGNNPGDLTVADRWQGMVAARSAQPIRALAPAAPVASAAPVLPTRPAQVASPLPPPAGGATPKQPAQVQTFADDDQVQMTRPSRRLYFFILGLLILICQAVNLGLILNQNKDTSDIILGILLGNALNFLALAAICFNGVVLRKPVNGIINRSLWIGLSALLLSCFFISYGQFSQQTLVLPIGSFIILALSNILNIRELRNLDGKREQIAVAPVSWRSALVGAATGLLPLTIILVFALAVPLPWVLLRLLGVLLIGFIGAPTPGAMMAVWLSQRMSYPVLVRTSAISGILMFLAAYIVVVSLGLLIPGFYMSFTQAGLALLVMGALLGQIGALRGMLDAWIYHRIIMRR